jgi:hypothetical protein
MEVTPWTGDIHLIFALQQVALLCNVVLQDLWPSSARLAYLPWAFRFFFFLRFGGQNSS